jgi:hypothetical protein
MLQDAWLGSSLSAIASSMSEDAYNLESVLPPWSAESLSDIAVEAIPKKGCGNTPAWTSSVKELYSSIAGLMPWCTCSHMGFPPWDVIANEVEERVAVPVGISCQHDESECWEPVAMFTLGGQMVLGSVDVE